MKLIQHQIRERESRTDSKKAAAFRDSQSNVFELVTHSHTQ